MGSKILLLLTFINSVSLSTAEFTVGVNYGRVADNLPPPSQVSQFIITQTTINHVKIFDANPDVIKAFANTNISLTITVPNDAVSAVSKPSAAQSWVYDNVLPFLPATKIKRILVGNEILATGDKAVISRLLPSMKAIHSALQSANVEIQVSTPHSLGILSVSDPPSSGRFRRVYDRVIFAPILEFHRQTKTPFMVCPYPYFGYNEKTLDYALFKPNGGVLDKATGVNYTNMLDAQMDAVYSAMKRVGYGDVDIVVAETGWPSAGNPNQFGVSVDDAASYNGNLMKHMNSGAGTPLMPNRTFETFIFSLFNENLKTKGPSPEAPSPSSDTGTKKWCITKEEATDAELQANIDFVCGSGVDCKPIQGGGPCYEPDNVRSHASYAMNAYYQAHGRNDFDCDFSNTGVVSSSDPSYEECAYAA
ncbi:hypothetical protein RD792_010305 [Penstemon davidsonii]|uniref:X8 domain-containing protein n=1 Tax=Penstemon davidsonii TaxID=160366 RepID=A0ABR0D1P2_9LAMI|nr:hypothetical protein RD792_010305 [Penstemon davidsonii]